MRSSPPIILRGQANTQFMGDCACSPSISNKILLKPIQTTSSLWVCNPSLHQVALDDNNHTLFFDPFGFSNVLVLNSSAVALFDSFSVPHNLDTRFGFDWERIETDRALTDFVELGLLRPRHAKKTIIQDQDDSLSVWLHITNRCNLRCTYCYLDKNNDQMNEETGLAALETIFASARQHGLKHIKLKYAGGEATLNFALVRTLHRYAVHLATQYDIQLDETILSNGVSLTSPLLDFIKTSEVNLTISLDGIGVINDQQRTFINGRGSFVAVERSLDKALSVGIKPHFSITVTGHNANHLIEAVRFALDRELRFNLNFYRDNDCSSHLVDLRNDNQLLIEGLHAAFDEIEQRLPSYRLIDGLIDRSAFHRPHTRTCGSGHNYLVIDHHGQVSSCQMEIEHPITNIYAADPLTDIRASEFALHNVSVDEKEGCRDCIWKYWCAGGCSLLTLRATGRTDVKSPYCDVYKAIYPRLIKLEGLRLLKWGSDGDGGDTTRL